MLHVPPVTTSRTLAAAITLSLLLAGCVAARPLPTQTVTPPTPAPVLTSPPPTAGPTASPAPVLPSSVRTRGPDEQVLVTDHFVVYYQAEVSPTQATNVAQYMEAAWRDIPPYLGIEPPSHPTRVFIMVSPGVISTATGGMIALEAGRFVVGYAAVPHEFTHILTDDTGPNWMEEGLAMYVQERFPAGQYLSLDGITVDSWSIGLLQAGKWVTLTEFPPANLGLSGWGAQYPIWRAYWESGSLVKYLIETYGPSAFQEMLGDADGWGAAEKVYGRPVDALIEEWRRHLESSSIPPEDCPECVASFLEWIDLGIEFEQEGPTLSGEAQVQLAREEAAVFEAFCLKDGQAMQQHLGIVRSLVQAGSDQ